MLGSFSLRRASRPGAQPWTRPWSPHRRQLVKATQSDVNSLRVFCTISPEVPKGSRVVPCSSQALVKPQRNLRVHIRPEECALALRRAKPTRDSPRQPPRAVFNPSSGTFQHPHASQLKASSAFACAAAKNQLPPNLDNFTAARLLEEPRWPRVDFGPPSDVNQRLHPAAHLPTNQ